MKSNFFTPKFIVITIAIFIAALTRLMPHPPNFTPIAAMALFGGAFFTSRRLAFMMPFVAMLISDIILVSFQHAQFASLSTYFFAPSTLAVYVSFAIIVIMGMRLNGNKKAMPILGATVLSSLLFFVITNFAVWAGGMMYPHSFMGLMICYETAIPFFSHQILGDVFFSTVLFGGFYLAQLKFPVLAKTHANL